MTTGALLMTYGAPADSDDIPRYLSAVRGGRAVDEALVDEMRRRYARIGGSPLIRITESQARALERELGAGWVAAAGMRFSSPSIAEAVGALAGRGAARVVGICMSPQWSPMLMGGYERELTAAARRANIGAELVGPWYRDHAFVSSIADRLRATLARDGDAFVVLTAHSLPKRVFDAEPEYIAQLRATGELIATAARLRDGRWAWAYQSAGHTQEEWLRPDLVELFPGLVARGERSVLVVPVQFLADHLEVLYDLDVAAAAQAKDTGLVYRRLAMPNTDATFIRALAGLARATGLDREGASSHEASLAPGE